MANEQARLDAARAATTAYVAKLKELYTQELSYIGSLSSLTAADVQAAKAQPAAPAQAPQGQEGDRVFDQIQFDEEEDG